MSSLSRRALLVSLSLASLAVAPAARANCYIASWHIQLLTPLASPLPQSASYVIALEARRGTAVPDVHDLHTLTAQLRQGATVIPLRVDVLAPGLARLVPSQLPAAGRWSLEIASLAPQPIALDTRALPPPPAAPTVNTRVTFTRDHYVSRPGVPQFSNVVADWTRPSPAGSIALLVSWASSVRSLPVPVGYGRTPTGSSSTVVFGDVATCVPPLDGATPPAPGMSVWYEAVDAFGQRSAATSFAPLRFPSTP